VAGGCVVHGSTIRHSLLSSRVRVQSGCVIESAVILPDVIVGRGAVLRRAVVDGGTRIPPGFTVGVDADHDRERFHVTPAGIALVTADALARVAATPDIRQLGRPRPTVPRGAARSDSVA
jgi:glucose-1-phosphate adenylyltransferase